MKSGIYVIILGVLGIVIGAALYIMNYHHTIGEGGIGIGIILVIVGAAMMMMKEKVPAPAAPAAPQ